MLRGVFPNSRLLKDVKMVKTNFFTYQFPTMPHNGFSSTELSPSLGLLVLQVFVCISLKVSGDAVALLTTYGTASMGMRMW